MAINLQTYLDRISSLGMVQLPTQPDVTQNLNTDSSVSDKDSYIPSVNNAEAVIPSSNYGADGLATETAAVEENQGASTENGASGSSGSSNSEDETTVEVVVINGIRYLETTRVENGVEIKTRKVLDVAEDSE